MHSRVHSTAAAGKKACVSKGDEAEVRMGINIRHRSGNAVRRLMDVGVDCKPFTSTILDRRGRKKFPLKKLQY